MKIKRKLLKKSRLGIKSLTILLFTIILPIIINSPLFMTFNGSTDQSNIEKDIIKEPKLHNPINHPPFANYFKYYKNITIDHTKVSGSSDLINFPVVLFLVDKDLHDFAQPYGQDIAFAQDTTWLDHEIELYNQSYTDQYSKLIVWVRILSLSPSQDTIITMYYGNSTMSSRENPVGVWDQNYVGVWHLLEDPPGQIYDSTSNDFDGTLYGSMNSDDQVKGKIDGSLDFDGNDDYIVCGDKGSFQDEITLSFWVKIRIRTPPGTTDIMGKGYEYKIYQDASTGGRLTFTVYTSTTTWMSSAVGSFPIQTWIYVAAKYDGVHTYIYVNSTRYNERELTGAIYQSSYDLEFCKRGSSYFNGSLDEIRISNTSRSDDWITTEYNNQNDPNAFISIGSAHELFPRPVNYFKYYKVITIKHTKVSGSKSLNNFPVLIDIYDSDLKSKTQENGNDIAFNYNNNWLDHQIELYNPSYSPTQAHLVSWVRIPWLSPSEDTDITMYYGNNTMDSQENPVGVWDVSYGGVWHLHDDFKDSTRNHNDGTNFYSSDIPGKIGDAQDFAGYATDQEITIEPDNTLNPTYITGSAWIYPRGQTDEPETGMIISDYFWETGKRVYYLYIHPNNRVHVYVYWDDGSTYSYLLSEPIVLNEWHLLHFTVNSSTLALYIDGVPINPESPYNSTAPIIGGIEQYLNIVEIGSEEQMTGTHEFNGEIDEVRISNIAHSADWILTEYNNQYEPNNFYNIGTERLTNGTQYCQVEINAIDLYGNSIPNVNISIYNSTALVRSDIANTDGSISFSNLEQGEYNFTVTMTSNIGNYVEIVNITTILVNETFQTVNLICNVGMNFFSIVDIDEKPLESGWIIAGNSTHNLQNCTIDSKGKTKFWWLNTTPYHYNYTVYYRNNMYNPKIINLKSGDITSVNSSIQVHVGLTTIVFTILTFEGASPVSGAKIKLCVNNSLGNMIANLTTDVNGKATLRWLNSTGIGGNYSLQIEFFGENKYFNNSVDGLPIVKEINFTVKNEDNIEFKISLSLENFKTEIVDLNPTNDIQIEWGSQVKIRVLFNISKAIGAPHLLGPTYADSVSYKIFKAEAFIQSGTMTKEQDNIGRYQTIINTDDLNSDSIYLIKISARKSGFTLPSDLTLVLDILNNDMTLNQSENDDSIQQVYWLESINMSVKPYGQISETFNLNISDIIFKSIDHSFNFSIPDIKNSWNLSKIIFNIYNISWNVNESDINVIISAPSFGIFNIFNKSNHNGWNYEQSKWTGITLDINKESSTGDNNFEFTIGGSFDGSVDIIADTYFIRDTINIQYSKFNTSEEISILTGEEGWAIKNITFALKNCYYTSNWTKVDLSTLTNFNITTDEGFIYQLDSGGLGFGTLTIDNRIIYPIDNKISFKVNSKINIMFDVIIKIEFIQEFYKNQHLETLNLSNAQKNILNGGNFQVNVMENGWNDDQLFLMIADTNNGTHDFFPSQLRMNITIEGQIYSISDVSLGKGIFSLEGFNKNTIYTAFIETSQPVNFTISFNTINSRIITYETQGQVKYIIIEKPDIHGNVQYNSNLRNYIQTIDTSLLERTDQYQIKFTVIKENYFSSEKYLNLIVKNRLTLINDSSELFRIKKHVYIKDAINFTFSYKDAFKGTKIIDLDEQYYRWEKYDSENNIIDSGEGTLITSIDNLYILDFNTETLTAGEYFLLIILNKDNYESKMGFFTLYIEKREIKYNLSDNFIKNQVGVVKGNIIPIEIHLTDPTKGNIPLMNATIKLTINNITYEFGELENGMYILNYPTSNVNAFFTSKTFTGIINITKEDYISEEFAITVVVQMEEIFPGMPTFYFLIIIFAIVASIGSIAAYRVYKHATIPLFVKRTKAMRKAIKGSQSISDSLIYPIKEIFIGEIVRDKWNKLGLSLGDILGIEIKKSKKLPKIKTEQIRERKVHALKPLGLILMRWDERIGTEILAKYPTDIKVSEKTLMQVYGTHEYSGERGTITLTTGSMNILSYYTGPELGYYIMLILTLDDDPDEYEGAMSNISYIILQNLANDTYIQMIPSLLKRLSVYPSLSGEQNLIFYYQDDIKKMIINILRDFGVIMKSELIIWLKERYPEELFDLDAILVELIKNDILKVVSVKKMPSELIFLTKDIIMLRIPPIELLEDPINRGLPTQFSKIYRTEVREFFQKYIPHEDDNVKIIDILADPQVYDTLRLLRTAVVTMKDLEKLKNKGVDDVISVLKKLYDAQMIRVYKDENGNEYYALLSDFYIDLLFPKYLLKNIKLSFEQKSKSDQVLLQYLTVLEESYLDLKSKAKKK